MQIMDAVHATEADATSFETFDEAFESPNRESNETMVQCAMRVRASVERVREMGISIDRQLEGYLILKKVVLDKSEVLTMTSLTGGNYDAETIQCALKKIQEKGRVSIPDMMAASSTSSRPRIAENWKPSDEDSLVQALMDRLGGPEDEDEAFFEDEVADEIIEEDEAMEILTNVKRLAEVLMDVQRRNSKT